jgi:pyruvate formate lyase activating enzyme
MDKQIREAMFYNKLPENKVHCFLCPWNCKIAPDKYGFCGVRSNKDGKLLTHIYGLVSSVAADPIEKKPLFHFYPGTNVLSLGTYGCNMRCGHCQNWQIAHVILGKDQNLPARYIDPEQLIGMAKEANCKGIAWTYNEPVIWFEYAYDGAVLAKKNKLYTVFVTNGYITPEALDKIGPYLDAFRVDVKGFNKEFYSKLTKIKDFSPILEAAERAKKKWNMHVEIVTNVIPTMNDDDAQLKGIAEWIVKTLGPETPWHVTRFVPYLEYADLPATPIETLEKAQQIGMLAGLQYVYIGNVTGHKGENTYCPKCRKLLIERVGYQTDVKQKLDKCNNCGEALTFRA